VGRTETDHDLCAVARIQEDFRASGDDLRELMVSIVTSDSFRYLEVPSGVSR